MKTPESGILRLKTEGKDAVMWKDVKSKIAELLLAKDIEGIAHVLACSFDGDRKINHEQRREVFTNPALVPHQEQLWKAILEDNASAGTAWDYRDEAYRLLTEEYGWDI